MLSNKETLSKRELIAALALQGLLSWGLDDPETTARIAVENADALLKELSKVPEDE